MRNILLIIKRNKTILFLIIFLLPIYFFLYKIYIPRVNAFGCFDDCYNIVAGYFISKGKSLYKDIPFNHQMLMPYISYLIQVIYKPINIYDLILRHRQFLILFSLLMNILLVIRFRYAAFAFTLFYEFSKFYIFGDRFLAEGFIVYPLVYIIGLLWYKLQKKNIYTFDYLLLSIFVWFIIFMREPYTLAALFIFCVVIFGRYDTLKKIAAIILLIILSSISLSIVSLHDYFFNLYSVNINGVLQSEINGNHIIGTGLFKVFFYPIYLFFSGEWNHFRVLLIGLDIIFLASIIINILKIKKISLALIIFLLFGLLNLRLVVPGKIFYESFHLLPWFSTFVFITYVNLYEIFFFNKKAHIICLVFSLLLFIYFIFSPFSYIKEKPDPHFDLLVGYGNYMEAGETIRLLSDKDNTLFVDGFDELIYWQADRISPYKFNWYTSYMPMIHIYSEARNYMFKYNPPDFYYGSCPKEGNAARLLPLYRKKDYIQLYSRGKPTCLYINKFVINEIPKEKWNRVKEYGYDIPSEKK